MSLTLGIYSGYGPDKWHLMLQTGDLIPLPHAAKPGLIEKRCLWWAYQTVIRHFADR
jgi:hypothetical protein